MRKRKFKSKGSQNQEMVLQITSMADIFTILLVFLLKSLSSGVADITPNADITLPESKKPQPIEETIKLEIAKNTILLGEKAIATLNDFQFDVRDLDPAGLSKVVTEAFVTERTKQQEAKQPPSKILVLADQNMPYLTLKKVLASASQSGFSEYRLVVVEDE